MRPVVKKAKPLAAETPIADENDRNDTQDSEVNYDFKFKLN